MHSLGAVQLPGRASFKNAKQERIFDGPAVTMEHLGNLRVIGIFEIPAIFGKNLRHIEHSSCVPKLPGGYQDFPYFRWALMRFPATAVEDIFRLELGAGDQLAASRLRQVLGLAQGR